MSKTRESPWESTASSSNETKRANSQRFVALSFTTKLLYGMPNFFTSAFNVFMGLYLTKFYVDDLGMAPTRLAVVSSINGSLNLFLDLSMGWWVDRISTRWGRRRPLIFVAAPLLALANVAIFYPPLHIFETLASSSLSAADWLLLWFAGWSVVRSFTPLSLPYNALGPELTMDDEQRDKMFALKHVCNLAGSILGAAVPALMNAYIGTPDATLEGESLRSELVSRHMAAYPTWAAVNGIATTLAFWLLAISVREVDQSEKSGSHGKKSADGDGESGGEQTAMSMMPGLFAAMRNKPFRILLTLYMIDSFRGLLYAGLFPFYIQYVIGATGEAYDTWASTYSLVGLIATSLSTPVWVWIASKVGKRNAWLLGEGICVPIGVFVWWFVGRDAVWIYAGFIVAISITAGGSAFFHTSVRAWVIDYDELRTGRRREGQYVTFWGLIPRWISLPGSAISFSIIDALGFKSNADVQNESVTSAIRFLAALVPSITGIIPFSIMLSFPISRAIHASIVNGISDHAAGKPAKDPLTGEMIPVPITAEASPGDSQEEDALAHFWSRPVPSGLIPLFYTGSVPWSRVGLTQALWGLVLVCLAVPSTWFFVTHTTVEGYEQAVVATLAVASCSTTGAILFALRARAAIFLARLSQKRKSE